MIAIGGAAAVGEAVIGKSAVIEGAVERNTTVMKRRAGSTGTAAGGLGLPPLLLHERLPADPRHLLSFHWILTLLVEPGALPAGYSALFVDFADGLGGRVDELVTLDFSSFALFAPIFQVLGALPSRSCHWEGK